jgi:SAM-dependent methyltransferase
MADVTYDGRTFPFGSGEFDAVFTSQVLEHVFDPDRFLGEIHRVLKTDGLLLLTVPFIWEEHEAPYDRQRYTSFGLRHVLSRAGFAVVQQRKSAPGLRALAQLVASYVYAKTLAGRDYCLRRLGAIVLIAPINLLGALLCRVLPGHDALYLDNVVLARKQAPDRD